MTDLDNTLYDWVDYFAPAFRSMMHVLHREIEIPEELLLEEARTIYKKYGTLEYSWLVQNMESVRFRPPDEVENLVKAASGAFRRVRKSRLRPYPGVKETLSELRNYPYLIVGASNAPRWLAAARLKHLHIIHLFDGLVAAKGYPPTEDDQFARVQDRDWQFLSQIPWTCELEDGQLKPSSYVYELIASQFRVDPYKIWVIGDNVQRDLAPAFDLGMHTAWARYGTITEPKNLATILDITPWDRPREKLHPASPDRGDSVVEATIDSFRELLDLILMQGRLF